MTKGKVVLVPFPFDDLTASKVRPAVCLTDPIGSHRHVVIAFISSQTPRDLLGSDVLFDLNGPDFAATGLRVGSVLRLHRLVTLTTALIQRQLGELSPARIREVEAKLIQLFGIEGTN
jgi:mRNA interferase MazF